MKKIVKIDTIELPKKLEEEIGYVIADSEDGHYEYEVGFFDDDDEIEIALDKFLKEEMNLKDKQIVIIVN